MEQTKHFYSTYLENWIHEIQNKLVHRPKTKEMFSKCIRNTIDTTFKQLSDGTTFVITGDIPAMWLRDSAAQARIFIHAAERIPTIRSLILGIIERQFQFILQDPYANAFNETSNSHGHQSDITDMKPYIWERKYEIDSLCYPVQLAYLLWKNTGVTLQFNETLKNAFYQIIDLWKIEQNHEKNSQYRFVRKDCVPTDTLPRNGKGNLVAYTGMTWSGFRPSDDACQYGYLIPANYFAVTALRYMEEISITFFNDKLLSQNAKQLADEILEGIQRFGVIRNEAYGEIFSYETDGLGNYNLMDDANVPSLLSLPYLGCVSEDDLVYQNTRRFILSKSNPYYFEGEFAKGIGSPHTPDQYVWHISIAMQGLTSSSMNEKLAILDLLEMTDAGTGFMHEGFHVDNPKSFTRGWFSWANMLYCELVLDVIGIQLNTGISKE